MASATSLSVISSTAASAKAFVSEVEVGSVADASWLAETLLSLSWEAFWTSLETPLTATVAEVSSFLFRSRVATMAALIADPIVGPAWESFETVVVSLPSSSLEGKGLDLLANWRLVLGVLTIRDNNSSGFITALIVWAIEGEDKSRECVTRARSVIIPFLSMIFTMLLKDPDWLRRWEGRFAWPEGVTDGQDSIIVYITFAKDWIRLCFSRDSTKSSDRLRAAFTSDTRLVWASGQWLQEDRAEMSTRDKAGQSLSPIDWLEGRRLSRIKAREEQSSVISSDWPAWKE